MQEKRKYGLRIAGSIFFWALALGVAAMLFGFSGQSGTESRGLSVKLTEWVLRCMPFIRAEAAVLEHILRKAAHFCLFAAEGFALYLALRFSLRSKKRALIIAAPACAVLGVLNELHQLLDAERSCQVSDMLLDFAGSITGMLAAALIIWIAKRPRRR